LSARADSGPGLLTRKRVGVSLLVALPIVLVPSSLIGYFAARPHTGGFDWELAAIFGTALGTTLLAAATAALAYATSGDLLVTRQLAEIGEQQLQVGIKPWLADAPFGQHTIDRPFFDNTATVVDVRVPFRNVGVGLALIQVATMHWDAPAEAVNPTNYGGTVPVRVLPPGEITAAAFRFPDHERPRVARIFEVGRFWIEISYTDSMGKQGETARIELAPLREGEQFGAQRSVWYVTDVSFFRAGESEPFASTNPHY
jgi:hypothetical protein